MNMLQITRFLPTIQLFHEVWDTFLQEYGHRGRMRETVKYLRQTVITCYSIQEHGTPFQSCRSVPEHRRT